MLLNNQERSLENLHLGKFTVNVYAVNSNKLKYISQILVYIHVLYEIHTISNFLSIFE